MRLWLSAIAIVGCTDDRGPRLSSVEPSAAPAGVQVVLHGERLCGDTGDCDAAAGEIEIGLSPPTVRATVIEYEDTTAKIMIPPGTEIGATEIVVVVNERSSNALDFIVLAPGVQ